MKCILIDPAKQKVGRTEVNPYSDNRHVRRIIRCSDCQPMSLSNGLELCWNHLGMLEVWEDPSVAKKGFFVLINNQGTPLNFCLGRALIWKSDGAFDLLPLPDFINPDHAAKFVRFIQPANYAAAVEICVEMFTTCYDERRNQEWLWRALALCDSPMFPGVRQA